MPAYAGPSIERENDLASLANQAAIEIDGLIQGNAVELDAVHRLAAKISAAVTDVVEPGSPSSLLDVRTAVVVNKAISEATGPKNNTLDDLLRRAKEVTATLLTLKQGAAVPPERIAELKQLRNFCVSLSRH